MRRIALLFAVGVIPLAEGEAQRREFNFWTQCLVAPFRACASVSLSYEHRSYTMSMPGGDLLVDETDFWLRISNQQGTLPPELAGDGARYLTRMIFTGFSLTNELIDFGGMYFPTSTGNAGGSVPVDIFGGPMPVSGGQTQNQLIVSFIDNAHAIRGCADVSAADWLPWTCGGSLEYFFVWQAKVAFDESSRVTLQFIDRDPLLERRGEFVSCTSDVDCVTVTPEPVSLTLIATGFAGVAAAYRRRRKGGPLVPPEPLA